MLQSRVERGRRVVPPPRQPIPPIPLEEGTPDDVPVENQPAPDAGSKLTPVPPPPRLSAPTRPAHPGPRAPTQRPATNQPLSR